MMLIACVGCVPLGTHAFLEGRQLRAWLCHTHPTHDLRFLIFVSVFFDFIIKRILPGFMQKAV